MNAFCQLQNQNNFFKIKKILNIKFYFNIKQFFEVINIFSFLNLLLKTLIFKNKGFIVNI